MFAAIGQKFHDYYDQIPKDTLHTMARSAAFSFTATALTGALPAPSVVNTYTTPLMASSTVIDAYARPLMASSIGVLATVINALLSPFFTAVFGNDDQVTLYQEFTKGVIVVGLIKLVVSYATGHKVDLIANTQFFFMSTNLIKSLFHILPQLFDKGGYIQEANECRNFLKSWGIDTPPGANTTYILYI